MILKGMDITTQRALAIWYSLWQLISKAIDAVLFELTSIWKYIFSRLGERTIAQRKLEKKRPTTRRYRGGVFLDILHIPPKIILRLHVLQVENKSFINVVRKVLQKATVSIRNQYLYIRQDYFSTLLGPCSQYKGCCISSHVSSFYVFNWDLQKYFSINSLYYAV